MDSVLILTLAGTWHPDKTTSSSKNFVLAVTLELSLERKKKGRCCQTWYYLRKFGWRTSSYSCFDFRPIGDITLYKHFFSSLLREKLYLGCQRLFMRGFRFLSSLKKWLARKVFFLRLRRSCLRPKAEDESACGRRSFSSHARKNLWYPG